MDKGQVPWSGIGLLLLLFPRWKWKLEELNTIEWMLSLWECFWVQYLIFRRKKVLTQVSIPVSMLVFGQIWVMQEFVLCVSTILGYHYRASTRLRLQGPRFAEIWLQMVGISNGFWNPAAWPFEIWTNSSHVFKSYLKSGQKWRMVRFLNSYSHR